MLRFTLTAFLLIYYCFSNIALAKNKVTKFTIEASFIELHSGPGIGYPVINVIEKGELVELLVKRTSWLKVKDQRNNIGWLSQNDLTKITNQGYKVLHSALTLEDFQKRHYEAGVMYGLFEEANFFNLHLGYTLSQVFSSEVSIGKSLGEISDSNLYDVMLISQPFPKLIVIPFIGVGVGIITTKPHSVLADSNKRQDTFISTAIGLKYHLARNFILRAEYKHSLVLTSRNNNEEVNTWKLGFSVFF